jgi:hypothetical protein
MSATERGTERAKFDVIFKKANSYEIRKYSEAVGAETVLNDRNQAFGRLAKYIGVFGTPENQVPNTTDPSPIAMTAPVMYSAKPIAMTSPVIHSSGGITSERTMTFILPQALTYDTAPRPTNPLVVLKRLPEHTVAALQVNGTMTPEIEEQKAKELLQALQSDGIELTPEVTEKLERNVSFWDAAYYNAPFTPEHLKTNDVIIGVLYNK